MMEIAAYVFFAALLLGAFGVGSWLDAREPR